MLIFMRRLILLIVLTATCWSAGVQASAENIEQQRQWFKQAESIAHLPKSRRYKQLMAQLEDYPLRPYVELKTLMRFPYLSNKDNIDRFLVEHEGSPLDKPLRTKWLNYLARQDQGALFLHYYRDMGNTKLACKRLEYLMERQDQYVEALDQVEQLWLVGKSQPKECDGNFKAWQQAGRRTADKVWQRLTLAADGGNHTLIPYLKKLLPRNEQYLADLWLKVRRSPSYVSRSSNFPGKYAGKETEILTYGLRRLIWRDPNLAIKSWHKLKTQFTFSDEQRQRIASRFAIALASKNHKSAGEWLNTANRLGEDEELFRWHLTHLLRLQDWQDVLAMVEVAPEPIAQDLSFQYWQARGFEALNAPEPAKQHLAQVANHRHYYGFMASAKIEKQPELMDQPLSFTTQELSEVSTHPAAARAKEFYLQKRFVSARREWRFLQSELDERQNLMAAVLADSWGWHDRTIFALSKYGYLDDVKRRFPLAFEGELTSHARANDIDPAWAFAIARRESSFMTDAYSGAGAHGLMQLLPSTANFLAKSKVKTRTLFDAESNASYGTRYLRYLMDKVENNPVLATASYNAGWSRVKNWIPKKQSMPIDLWIETIPFKETRNYVKAVMAYRQIYSQRLGQDKNLFTDLVDMRIGPSA